ncbi:hypothetical protein CB1_000689020 [Camelus ferus]|nr:hypothetical protein CB1_000689020 [Camelus ferus]
MARYLQLCLWEAENLFKALEHLVLVIFPNLFSLELKTIENELYSQFAFLHSSQKAASDPDAEPPLGTRSDPDGLDENAKLTETYCAEKWHSLCNFFVNFWNG